MYYIFKNTEGSNKHKHKYEIIFHTRLNKIQPLIWTKNKQKKLGG